MHFATTITSDFRTHAWHYDTGNDILNTYIQFWDNHNRYNIVLPTLVLLFHPGMVASQRSVIDNRAYIDIGSRHAGSPNRAAAHIL